MKAAMIHRMAGISKSEPAPSVAAPCATGCRVTGSKTLTVPEVDETKSDVPSSRLGTGLGSAKLPAKKLRAMRRCNNSVEWSEVQECSRMPKKK